MLLQVPRRGRGGLRVRGELPRADPRGGRGLHGGQARRERRPLAGALNEEYA